MSPGEPFRERGRRPNNYRAYFDYAGEEAPEENFFDTDGSTDYSYFSRSRYEEEDREELDRQGTMAWEAFEEEVFDADFPQEEEREAAPGKPVTQRELEEERKSNEFKKDPLAYLQKEFEGELPQLAMLKFLCLAILVFLSVFQFLIVPLDESILYGSDSLLVSTFESAGRIHEFSYAYHPGFYVFFGLLVGCGLALLSALPEKMVKRSRWFVFLVLFVLYYPRAFGIAEESFQDGTGIVHLLFILLISFMIMCYLIVGEIGVFFLLAGPYITGVFAILRSSARGVRLSFALFVFYIWDATGTLSTNYATFLPFTFLLFFYLHLGIQIGEIQGFHKASSMEVVQRMNKVRLITGTNRNLPVLNRSLDHYFKFSLTNLSCIFLFSLIIFYSNTIFAFFLPSSIGRSVEILTITGKLISITTLLLLFMFLKLFFGSPTDKVDRKVFKKRRLERILSQKRNAFYVESTMAEGESASTMEETKAEAEA